MKTYQCKFEGSKEWHKIPAERPEWAAEELAEEYGEGWNEVVIIKGVGTFDIVTETNYIAFRR